MLDERSRSNSHRTLAVHRVEDNEVGSNSRSKLSPAPVRSLKRKSNFYQKKPSFSEDNKESSAEDVGDFQIQHGRSTLEIRTRDKSDLEDDESDLEVRLISGYKDDESVLEDDESALEDDESVLVDDESVLGDDEPVLRDDESDLEEFPMRNTAFEHQFRPDLLELVLIMFDPLNPYEPSRWALLLKDEYLNVEDVYQLLGGPNVGEPFEFRYEPGELGSFRKPDGRYHIGWVPRRDRSKVYRTANKSPHKFSQRWALEIIWNLESQGIICPGTGNVLRKLEQEDMYPKERIDMVSVIEREKARPFHQKVNDWARQLPDCVSKLLGRVNCRIVVLAIDYDPSHKHRLRLQNQYDLMEHHYAVCRHVVVKFVMSVDRCNWFDLCPESTSLVYIYGRPVIYD